jgi:ABC-type methionine transport system permease subunit
MEIIAYNFCVAFGLFLGLIITKSIQKMQIIKKFIDRVINFETNFYRSLFLVLCWWGLLFLILFLSF